MKLRLCALALGAGVAVQAAAPVIQSIKMVAANARLTVQAEVGSPIEIQYSTNLSQTNWTVLTNLVMAENLYLFVDAPLPPRLSDSTGWGPSEKCTLKRQNPNPAQ